MTNGTTKTEATKTAAEIEAAARRAQAREVAQMRRQR